MNNMNDINIDKAFEKMIINSRYNEFHETKSYFEMFDKDRANRITKTGKKLVRKITTKLNGEINKKNKTKKK